MNGLECHLFIALSPHLWDRVPGVGLAGQRVSARVNLLETKSPTGLVVHVSLPASPSSRLLLPQALPRSAARGLPATLGCRQYLGTSRWTESNTGSHGSALRWGHLEGRSVSKPRLPEAAWGQWAFAIHLGADGRLHAINNSNVDDDVWPGRGTASSCSRCACAHSRGAGSPALLLGDPATPPGHHAQSRTKPAHWTAAARDFAYLQHDPSPL